MRLGRPLSKANTMAHTIQLFQLLLPSLLLLQHASGEEVGGSATLINTIIDLLGGSDAPYGECKGCFCIPEGDISDPSNCPSTTPKTDYADLVPILKSFQWKNPFSLECDPYDEEIPCDTTPPLEEGGACVVEFSGPKDGSCPDTWSFTVRTYTGTFEEAVNDKSLVVTHATPCGACSSLQDLSVYMDRGGDLTDVSTDCGFEGILNKENGIQCFVNLGFTPGCAAAWYYNTKKTASECFAVCATTSGLGLPPVRARDCELSRCLACDEENAGPLFKLFAGRTRRNSGLLSHIARPCSAIVPLEHQNPCELSIEEENKVASDSRSRPLNFSILLVWSAIIHSCLVYLLPS